MSHSQFYRALCLYLLTVSPLIMGNGNDSDTYFTNLPSRNILNSTYQLLSNSSTKAEKDMPWIADCQKYNETGSSCESCADKFILWPTTEAGEMSKQPCPTADGMPQLTGFARRFCDENGTWFYMADFDDCIDELLKHEEHNERRMKINTNSTYIYLGGFILSNIAMIIAISIFARYKHLRCLRNLIHSQLFLGITIKNFLWMGIMIGTLNHKLFEKPLVCKTIFTLYRFFHLSQFSWMFIEGLYLFIVVANALLTNLLRLKHCMLIGWGVPLAVTVTCVMVNVFTSEDGCWQSGQLHAPANTVETFSITFLLVVNTAFMVAVIYTLVRKLKNSALNESKQYKKAVRATIILVPLLGGTYLMLFFSPSYATYAVWVYFNSIIQSTLGFIVALVYCFLNGEVRTSLAKSHRRWKDEQTLPAHDWWSRKRRSSYAIKREETETDTTTCQYSSRRNSRRVSEDTVSSSRRGSHIPDTIFPTDLTSNKLRKTSPLAFRQPLMEKESIAQPTLVVAKQNKDNSSNTFTQLTNNVDRLDVVRSVV